MEREGIVLLSVGETALLLLTLSKTLLAILLLLPLVVYGEHHAGVEGVDLVDGNPQKAESAQA